jgi:hypothetical protein
MVPQRERQLSGRVSESGRARPCVGDRYPYHQFVGIVLDVEIDVRLGGYKRLLDGCLRVRNIPSRLQLASPLARLFFARMLLANH